MNEKLDIRRISIYLFFAFSIAWAAGFVMYQTGGLVDSPALIPNTPITLALVLLTLPYMWGPSIAHILTRLITREGWSGVFLWPKLKRGWKYLLAAWFGPAILTILGGAVFYLVFPGNFDPTLGAFQEIIAQTAAQSGQAIPIPPWVLILIELGAGITLAPLINGIFTFGEEFGWRAYLQPKLMPLGGRKAMILMGIIWGVWHWPVTAMGHNYGLEYPGFPWLGMLVMVWFTFVVGVFFGWVTLRSGSVWPAVIGHAALNAIATLPYYFVTGEPSTLIGPMPVGLVGSAGFATMALWIMLKRGALDVSEEEIEETRDVEESPPSVAIEEV